jgi:hypothetical protein
MKVPPNLACRVNIVGAAKRTKIFDPRGHAAQRRAVLKPQEPTPEQRRPSASTKVHCQPSRSQTCRATSSGTWRESGSSFRGLRGLVVSAPPLQLAANELIECALEDQNPIAARHRVQTSSRPRKPASKDPLQLAPRFQELTRPLELGAKVGIYSKFNVIAFCRAVRVDKAPLRSGSSESSGRTACPDAHPRRLRRGLHRAFRFWAGRPAEETGERASFRARAGFSCAPR